MGTLVAHDAIGDRRARLSLPIDRDLTNAPPATVARLIDLLDAPGGPDLDAVEIALQSPDLDAEKLGNAVHTSRIAYVRTLLYRGRDAEMLALTWLPGQRSPVHDHGQSTCVVRVISGVATETLYRAQTASGVKRAYKTRDLRAGTVTRAAGAAIHSLGNSARRGEQALVTLHVYSPPLGSN